MSRIFEALQRSEVDRVGLSSSPSAIATELLQAAEREESDSVTNQVEDSSTVVVSPPANSRLICLTAKDSLAAEKFRFLAVRLRQFQQIRPLKKVLITSSIPEEGKSMVAANLAITLARKQNLKVLLLEGDLRRPTLPRQFGIAKVTGLSEWLQSELQPISLYRIEGAGLWFLPAGKPPSNPLELMQSRKLPELMEQLASQFDWIIIDSPPVLPLADTSLWMRLSDGILLVTRESVTEKRQLQRCLEAVEKSKLLGALLNSCSNTDHADYYQRYHSERKPDRNPVPEKQKTV